MDSPLINIITRVSRKNYFLRCRKSVLSQTYKNINHICTYENNEVLSWLSEFPDLSLVRVPKLTRIENMEFTFTHHPLIDDFTKSYEKKLYTKDSQENLGFSYVEPVKFEKNGYFCYSVDRTFNVKFLHSPYNLYLKIAEKAIKPGWVFYLDDDDYFTNDFVIEKLVENIKNFNENTLHVFRIQKGEYNLSPSEKFWLDMKTGHPFILHEIGGSNFIFHSKYADYTVWDEWSGADYRTSKCLERVIPNKNFIDDLVAIIAFGNHGLSVDI